MIGGRLICGRCSVTTYILGDHEQGDLETLTVFLNTHEGHQMGWEAD